MLDNSIVDEHAGFISDVLGKNIKIISDGRNGNGFGHMVISEDRLWYVYFNPSNNTGVMEFRRFEGKYTSVPEFVPIWSDVDMEFHIKYNLEGRIDG